MLLILAIQGLLSEGKKQRARFSVSCQKLSWSERKCVVPIFNYLFMTLSLQRIFVECAMLCLLLPENALYLFSGIKNCAGCSRSCQWELYGGDVACILSLRIVWLSWPFLMAFGTNAVLIQVKVLLFKGSIYKFCCGNFCWNTITATIQHTSGEVPCCL